ncbi:MAG: M14 family zinc carboxypeptidase, partial [Myxococcota bacterium]
MTLRFLRLLGAFVALNLATAACTDSQTPEPTESESSPLDAQAGPTVVRVFIDDPSDVFDLSDFDVLEFRDRSRGFVLVLTQPEEFDSLVAVGYPVEIDAARTESIRRPPANFASPLNVGIPGFPCYRTVEESYARAEELTLDYPHLASWSDVGDSWSKIAGGPGYDLFVLRLTNKNIPGDKPVLFATSSIHAREYTPAELSLRFAETLVEGYGTQPDATWLLDHHEVHLMIQANPDGRKEAEQGALWRKNTNQDHCVWRSSRGVDLNRNFSFEWSCCGGSSGRSCNSTFRGPSAASEPETVAVQDYA